MHLIKYILLYKLIYKYLYIYLFILIATGSCIQPFEPVVDPLSIGKYVVNGLVSDESELQTVSVSMASDVGEPQFIPVSGCSIIISDDQGNFFPMTETEKGTYVTVIQRSFIIPGVSYRVEITAPDGTKIESDFDRIPDCPDVDSVYFLRSDIIAERPVNAVSGIRFYLDFDGGNSESRFFRWELAETWEYKVPYPREWYYDGTVHHIFPADYSRQVCWITLPVRQIFTLSTMGLNANRYEMLPLNFVDNLGPKLVYGYSLLVRQLSLSEPSFLYWDRLRSNSYEQGGLYDRQPATVPGNLHNLTSPENKVLGFFGASSVKLKRLFVKDVENLQIKYVAPCAINTLRKGFIELKQDDLPVYLYGDKYGFYMATMSDDCVDCLKLGGVNVKPFFWPW